MSPTLHQLSHSGGVAATGAPAIKDVAGVRRVLSAACSGRAAFMRRSRLGRRMATTLGLERVDPGSRVRLAWSGWAGDVVHEGRLLPPALAAHVTLKLDNGYNVSHPVAGVTAVEVLEPPLEPPAPVATIDAPQAASDLPRVRIIHMGGTIASRVDYATGAVHPASTAGDLLSQNPLLATIARIDSVELGRMWSDDLRPQHWNRLLEATEEAFADGVAGVVVPHGTDTMHLTAAAVALAWGADGARAPGRIVFTGSQRSSDRGSSDAGENLRSAVHWAANGPTPNGGEGDQTVIVMHAGADDDRAVVLPGCAARKAHSSRRDAFVAVNHEPLAWIVRGEADIALEAGYHEALRTLPARHRATKAGRFDPDVRIRQLVAGPMLQPEEVDDAARAGVTALLVHGTGLGHLPIQDPLDDSPENLRLGASIKAFVDAGGVVVATTQCINGPVHLDVYNKGLAQQALGMLGHGSHAGPDAALVKLHWLVSQHGDAPDLQSAVAAAWARDLVGENPAVLRS